MIHLVFNEDDVNVIEEAIKLDESLEGKVVSLTDDYSFGPINDLYHKEGIESRREWWEGIVAGGDFEGKNIIDDHTIIATLVGNLRRDEEEIIWIWAAQNSHDVSGYYWILNYLKEFQGRIFILYLNNLPFINEKGSIFYPNALNEIPPKEFLKAKKLERPLTPSEFEVDPDEWEKLSSQNKGIRILEGGKKLIQTDYDYFDSEIKKYILPDWQKASKIIQQFLSKSKLPLSEAFVLWRLKTIVAMGLVEAQGNIGLMKDFELKIINN